MHARDSKGNQICQMALLLPNNKCSFILKGHVCIEHRKQHLRDRTLFYRSGVLLCEISTLSPERLSGMSPVRLR